MCTYIYIYIYTYIHISCDIHTHTPARTLSCDIHTHRSSTNFQLYYFVMQVVIETVSGMGMGPDCAAVIILPLARVANSQSVANS